MNKDIIITGIVIFLIALILLNGRWVIKTITGFITIGLSVIPKIEGIISFLKYPTNVIVGTNVSFLTEFKNTGTTIVNATTTVEIKDSDFQTIRIYIGENKSVGPGKRMAFNVYYMANTTGLYWVFINSSYDGQVAKANASFQVVIPPTTTAPAPAPTGGPAPITERIVTEEKISLLLNYPTIVVLNRGQSVLIPITVTNDGTIDLNNIIFSAFANGISIETNPTIIDQLSPESSTIFLISVKVPKEIEVGTYPIDFTITSDRITKEGHIDVEVRILQIEVEVNQSIENYKTLIEKLEEEINKGRKEGKDIKAAEEELNKAKIELEIVEELYNSGKYTEAKEKLEDVKNYIETAIVELAKTFRPLVIFLPIEAPRIEVILPLVVAVSITGYRYYRVKKEEERYEKSLRTATTIIKISKRKKRD